MPPDQVCHRCGSTDPNYTFEPVSGHGVIRSWTTVRQAFLPGFADDVPFVLVDVELAEPGEVRLIGRLLDGPEASPRLGAPVRVDWERVDDDVAVPAFVLAEGVAA
jgi:uncharacterized OB-fold protein